MQALEPRQLLSVATDAFDYAVNSNLVGQGTAADGWTSGWTSDPNNTVKLKTGSLVYTDANNNTLVGDGLKAGSYYGSWAERGVADGPMTRPASGTITRYVRVISQFHDWGNSSQNNFYPIWLGRTDSRIWTNNALGIIASATRQADGNFHYKFTCGLNDLPTGGMIDTGLIARPDTPDLLVLKVQIGPTPADDSATLWVNPPTTATSEAQLGAGHTWAAPSGRNFRFDYFRFLMNDPTAGTFQAFMDEPVIADTVAGVMHPYTLGAPTVGITADDPAAAEEGQHPATFTVSRSNYSGRDLEVTLNLSGTADASDFVSVPSTVTIPAGENHVTFSLTPVDDQEVEPTEDFALAISTSSGYGIDTNNASAAGTIADNDVALDSLTVSNEAWGDETATVDSTSSASLDLAVNADGYSVVDLTAGITSSATSPYAKVLYSVTDALGAPVAAGSLAETPTPITLPGAGAQDAVYYIRAGVDTNGDGVFDVSEVTRTLQATNKSIILSPDTSDPHWKDGKLVLTKPPEGTTTINFAFTVTSNGKGVRGMVLTQNQTKQPPAPAAAPGVNWANGNGTTDDQGKVKMEISVAGGDNGTTAGEYTYRVFETTDDSITIDLVIVIQ